jgi:hypothetical protein
MDYLKSLWDGTLGAIRSTPGWAVNAVHTLMGSRFFVGVTGLFFVAFLGHVRFASERFPPVTTVSFTHVLGFAPAVEQRPLAPDEVRTQAAAAAEAAKPYAQDWYGALSQRVADYFGAHSDAVVAGNYMGLTISGVLFLIGLYLLARQETRAR